MNKITIIDLLHHSKDEKEYVLATGDPMRDLTKYMKDNIKYFKFLKENNKQISRMKSSYHYLYDNYKETLTAYLELKNDDEIKTTNKYFNSFPELVSKIKKIYK